MGILNIGRSHQGVVWGEYKIMSEFYYEPKTKTIKIDSCLKADEYLKLVQEINSDSTLSLEQKQLLKYLATRFITFRFDKIADYYTITTPNMQEWLERVRSVIVDTDSAIKNGYIRYKENYLSLIESITNEK